MERNGAAMGKPVKVKKESYSFINVIAVVACLGVIVVILTVLFASYIFDRAAKPADNQSVGESSADEVSDIVSGEETSEESQDNSHDETSSETSTVIPSGYTTVTLNQTDIRKGDLIIVNNDKQYDFSVENPLVSIYENRSKNYKLIDGSLQIAEKLMPVLNQMLDDLYNAVGSNALTITAAYRTKAEQQSAYDQGKDTAVGGGSDLHTGLSFRCTIYPATEGSLTEGKFLWLAENCKNYGFVLRYPAGKESITGFAASSSSFRYVGKPHAHLMTLNDYCLEEYVDFVKRFSFDNQYRVDVDGVTYAIYYCQASTSGTTTVKIPEGAEYTISGDNSAGFIVTAIINQG
jgi:D-alanyl-D-alanine carboxypeptidase